MQNGCSSPQLHCTSAAPQHKVDVKTDTELPSDASSELSLPEPEGQPWDDRCPAEIAPVGTILPWNAPSLFNTASLVSVLTAAPVTEEQLFPIAWGWEKTGYPEELPLASGVTEGLDVVRRQAENDDHPTTDTKPSGTDDLEDKDAASRAERADSCEPVDLEVHWPKRHALPLLDFLDEKGRPPAATIGSTGKIVECRPKPGSSLQLDELLAAGVDVPSQVWRCTVLPSEYTVVLKLLTDQARLDPPEKRITREVYSRVRDYSKASLGRNAQMDINLEADVFEALGPLQGTRVPYSYGYYAVRGTLATFTSIQYPC